MSTSPGPAAFEPPASAGRDSATQPDGIQNGPDLQAAAPPPVPAPVPPPATRAPSPAMAVVLLPVFIGCFGLLVASIEVVAVTQGRAAGPVGLGWAALALVVVFRLAWIWQERLNNRPLYPRQPRG